MHFKDYLTHKGIKHVFSCKQALSLGQGGKIYRIKHIQDPEQQEELNRFLSRVGLA